MNTRNFRVLEPALAATDGEMCVRLVGWHEIHFSKDGRVIVFLREPLFEDGGGFAYEVSPPASWRWEPPFENETVQEDQRPPILDGVRAGLAALGLKCVFPWENP